MQDGAEYDDGEIQLNDTIIITERLNHPNKDQKECSNIMLTHDFLCCLIMFNIRSQVIITKWVHVNVIVDKQKGLFNCRKDGAVY